MFFSEVLTTHFLEVGRGGVARDMGGEVRDMDMGRDMEDN